MRGGRVPSLVSLVTHPYYHGGRVLIPTSLPIPRIKGGGYPSLVSWGEGTHVRNLDAIYCKENSTQSLIRIYLTLSLAKTQGSLSLAKTQGYVYVRIKR